MDGIGGKAGLGAGTKIGVGTDAFCSCIINNAAIGASSNIVSFAR